MDAGKARIPTLQVKDPTMKQVVRELADNDSKGWLLYNTFFPPANPTTDPILQDYKYTPPRWKFKTSQMSNSITQ
jgi:hypothetical protein